MSAVPLYLWCMLLLPSAVAAIYVAVRRRWVYAPIPFFSITSVFTSSVESIYTVVILKRFDQKFAPKAALELSLFGDAVISLIGLIFFGSTLAYYARRSSRVTARSIVVAALSGAVYPTVLIVLYWGHIQASLLIQWIWILLMPVAAAWLTFRQTAVQGSLHELPLVR